MKLKKKGLYRTNKKAKVGEIIECPVCHIKFKKIQWAQAFCCGHCKDSFGTDKIRIGINMLTAQLMRACPTMIGTRLSG